jgi:hypothetical protein
MKTIDETSTEKARAALLRVAMAAVGRAELLLIKPTDGVVEESVKEQRVVYQNCDADAARLLDAAAKALEVAIGPIDPPDADQ